MSTWTIQVRTFVASASILSGTRRVFYAATVGATCLASVAAMVGAAEAACLIGNTLREDIDARDCREAQTTGCVFRGLTFGDYSACRAAQPPSLGCLIGDRMRTDIADKDCQEAQVTGCVFHSLSPDQYKDCRARQPR